MDKDENSTMEGDLGQPEPVDPDNAVDIRQKQQKQLFIDQLRKTPIIQVVCEKLDVSRSTFYRWKKTDAEFSKACIEALEDGCQLVNDLAESSLMSAIKGENLTAIMFWLRTHHAKYKNKIDINANINNFQEQLTPDQQKVVDEALRLLSLSDGDQNLQGENKNEIDTANN
jgi:hypothetical protein